MRRTVAVAVIVFCCLIQTPAGSEATPESCFSIFSPDTLHIHIPVISFANGLYTIDLDYSSTGPTTGAGWFRYSGGGVSSLTACAYPAPLFFDGGKAILRVPTVFNGGFSFWLELEHVPSADGQIWFKASNAGSMPNRVFVTSVHGNANLGSWPDAGGKVGLEAADTICQARAQAGGLSGTFKAWLSDDDNDAYCRIHFLSGKKTNNCGRATLPASAGPWVRTDGFPFSGPIQDLMADKIYTPARLDEFGNVLSQNEAGTAHYFTFTDIGASFGSPAGSCSNWTSSSGSLGTTVGERDSTVSLWSHAYAVRCDFEASLLCFQTGAGPALPPLSMPGKKVFVTSIRGSGDLGSWPDGAGKTGFEAGNAICQARAAAAGLPNALRFKAWLSSYIADAKDRITSDGPWIRLDGVKIADTKADLLDGSLFTSISVTELGTYKNSPVWTGSTSLGADARNSCSHWFDDSTVRGMTGISSAAWSEWTAAQPVPCGPDANASIYCLED